jgi:uroporphyrinogen-III synthase
MGMLHGLHVVVTRPEHQAGVLCQLIESQGGNVIRFPLITVVKSQNQTELRSAIKRIDASDMIIFVSRNAVFWGLRAILDHGKWPNQIKVAAVGKGTAEDLERQGISVDILPENEFNSEALLNTAEFQSVQNKRIAIVRGEGGRELLAKTLRERGAQVDYVECYRRVKPNSDASLLSKAWENDKLDVIIVTSNESLENLVSIVSDQYRESLVKTSLIVISERMIERAKLLGFKLTPWVAEQASDQGLLDAVILWNDKFGLESQRE